MAVPSMAWEASMNRSVHSIVVPDCGLAVSRAITRAAIATIGMCLLLAWGVFELDDFWLGLGAGLVTGDLSSWVTAPMEAARGERVQRWLLWASVGGVGLSFVLLRSEVLTSLLLGALIAVWIHYFFDRYQQAIWSHPREQ
jgi:hypothetical protein